MQNIPHQNLLCNCGGLVLPDNYELIPQDTYFQLKCHCQRCKSPMTIHITTRGGIFIVWERHGGRHKSKKDKWQQKFYNPGMEVKDGQD